jgi:penicillin amidase
VLLPRGLRDPGSGRSLLALRRLLDGFAANRGRGASGLDFFAGGEGATPEERRDSVLLGSLERTLERLSGPELAAAFGGSSDQDDWRWGLLHRLVLEHPLGAPYSIPPALGRFVTGLPDELPGIPVDGGFEVIDAASHDARTYAVNDYMFDDGPVRRYVGRPGRAAGSIDGWTSMPGGASGTPGNPLSFNLLLRWLTNDPIRVRQGRREVQAGARGRHLFLPAKR